LRRTEIGEHQAVALLERIPGLPEPFTQRVAAIWLTRLLDAAALHVEQPAVVAAADASFLDLAVEQCRATMHAARIDEAGASRAVAEQHEVLAQHSHGPRQVT